MKKILLFVFVAVAIIGSVSAQTAKIWRNGQLIGQVANSDSIVFVEQTQPEDSQEFFAPHSISCDYVIYGNIFTAEQNSYGRNIMAEAAAVKDGKFVFVGSREDAQKYIAEGATVLDYSDKGMIMPTCANGHAHYLFGHAFKVLGTMIGGEDTPDKFLKEIAPAAVKKARDNNYPTVYGFGWNYHYFKENMPTRQDLDKICSDIPMYFADEEGHKGLANTKALVLAGIMDEEGTVLKKDKDIRGGEIVMDSDGEPSGLLLEQAGTYVRRALDNDNLYTVAIAKQNIDSIQKQLLAEGYTMYMDGWSNYFFNDHFYQAAQQLDNDGKLNCVIGMSHEIESWMTANDEITKATKSMKYASKHVMPQWIKLFIDGTVEGGTGYSQIPYPDGHQGIVNWNTAEVTDITRLANDKGLSMHIHTMGDSAVALAVDAYAAGGQNDKRNTVVHVRNVMDDTWQKMADHNITATSGMLWHQGDWYLPIGMYLSGMVPEGYEDKSYPMKSFFDKGINMSSSSDFPALTGCPDDPFGIMEIAVAGMSNPEELNPWWPEELISREQALQALTINGAKQMFLENERGSIAVGKYADFLVIDQDVLRCDLMDIHKTKVLQTYFEGNIVYPAK